MQNDPLLHSIKLSSEHYEVLQKRAKLYRRSVSRELQCLIDLALGQSERPEDVQPRFKTKAMR